MTIDMYRKEEPVLQATNDLSKNPVKDYNHVKSMIYNKEELYDNLSLFFNKEMARSQNVNLAYRKLIELLHTYNPDFDINTIGVTNGSDLVIGQYTISNVNISLFVKTEDPVIFTLKNFYTSKDPEYYDYNIQNPYLIRYEPVPAYQSFMSELQFLAEYQSRLLSKLPKIEDCPSYMLEDLKEMTFRELQHEYEQKSRIQGNIYDNEFVNEALKDFELD